MEKRYRNKIIIIIIIINAWILGVSIRDHQPIFTHEVDCMIQVQATPRLF